MPYFVGLGCLIIGSQFDCSASVISAVPSVHLFQYLCLRSLLLGSHWSLILPTLYFSFESLELFLLHYVFFTLGLSDSGESEPFSFFLYSLLTSTNISLAGGKFLSDSCSSFVPCLLTSKYSSALGRLGFS
jgi:hypothetical protein